MITVCYNCVDRCVGCHADWPAYAAEKERHEKEREKIRKLYLVDAGIMSVRTHRYKHSIAHYKAREM